MKHTAPKRQRCAIYTRKSTEHNLDLAFNSLDAQREACEAYIKSQAHEGWTLIRDHFDDGGLSGASLDRPALQDLLNRVRARQVDIVVVYKVDRLTRSLADFAKLVEEFDEHDVSFVSVTQSFNTTSSMGRLTLNVLLSFAQFEREVIGERVRDKIAASKRKGIWVGGPVPLGYRSRDKKLEVVPEEAEQVRHIFADYLAFGSIRALAAKLNTDGPKPKPRQLANGKTVQAECWRVGPLAHLLKNRFYIGEVVYRGEVNQGEHEPILDRDLFDAVQAKLLDQSVVRKLARRQSPHLLTGKLFDDRGNLMSPTHANKAGVRYRYYTSQALLQGRKADAGSVARVPADEIERLVLSALTDDSASNSHPSEREAIELHLVRATVRKGGIEIALRSSSAAEQNPEGPVCIKRVAFTPVGNLTKGIRHRPGASGGLTDADRTSLLAAIARSRAWVDAILSDPTETFETIAAREGRSARYIKLLAPLAYVSPRLIEALADGCPIAELTVTALAKSLPLAWAKQEGAYLRA